MTLKKFDVKNYVVPNGLEKNMAFMINKNLAFIDSMKLMNSILKKIIRNLSDNDFKFLIEKFGSKNFKFLKQKNSYPCECIDNYERFSEKNLPNKKCFYISWKDGKTGDNGKNWMLT